MGYHTLYPTRNKHGQTETHRYSILILQIVIFEALIDFLLHT